MTESAWKVHANPKVFNSENWPSDQGEAIRRVGISLQWGTEHFTIVFGMWGLHGSDARIRWGPVGVPPRHSVLGRLSRPRSGPGCASLHRNSRACPPLAPMIGAQSFAEP